MAGREKLWVVRPGDGATVAEIVARAGAPATAIAEGRVFVGKKRATRPDARVGPGDRVRIGSAPRPGPAGLEPQVLFVADGLVACIKPAGLPTVPDHATSAQALVARVERAIGAAAGTLRVTSRLDREVSGAVVFALDGPAEERLREARARGAYARRYVALAALPPGPDPVVDAGVWTEPIGRAADPRLRRVGGEEAKPAATRWRRVGAATGAAVAMLAVDPVTGRTHQIRVHASHAGAPLVGDRSYGGRPRLVLANGRVVAIERIALHAARVVVPAASGEPIEVVAPIPADLTDLWLALGGAPEAWNRALGCGTPVD